MTRIAIPSDDRQTIAPHFGRASGFLIYSYDGSALTSEYRPLGEVAQPGCCESGDQSRHERMVAALRDCDVIIAAGMGRGMMSALYEAGIEVALSSLTNAHHAADLLVADILPHSTGSGCCG
jgi:predicted Fe-Mo cluster-binding NifX family protein